MGRVPAAKRAAAVAAVRAQWDWRRHYRVWEANRRIFLYPESYLEPDLRDDRTPLFDEVAEDLLQQDSSEPTVTDAYTRYLAGLDGLIGLRLTGAFHEPAAATSRTGCTWSAGPAPTRPSTTTGWCARCARRPRPARRARAGVQRLGADRRADPGPRGDAGRDLGPGAPVLAGVGHPAGEQLATAIPASYGYGTRPAHTSRSGSRTEAGRRRNRWRS